MRLEKKFEKNLKGLLGLKLRESELKFRKIKLMYIFIFVLINRIMLC